jgi:hypothetical protein
MYFYAGVPMHVSQASTYVIAALPSTPAVQNIANSAHFAVKPESKNEKKPLTELPREASDKTDTSIRLQCD